MDNVGSTPPPFAPNANIELEKFIVNPGEQDPAPRRKVDPNRLCSKLGILAVFGVVYWPIITFIAFSIQFHDSSKSWLFKYCVLSMLAALCCQFSIGAMVMAGFDETNEYFRRRCTDLPITTLAVFPYALLLTADLFVHMGSTFLGKTSIDNGFSIAFIICDSISLFPISALYFGWHRADLKFRLMNFCFEWVDIVSQVAVTLLYSKHSDADNKSVITNVFWIFTLIQLFFWIVPLTLGSAQKMNNLVKHIIVLDIITDIPLIITTVVSEAYTVQAWILVDLIFKMILMLRGVVVNGCIYLLLPYLTK